jgi:hypothetical protein
MAGPKTGDRPLPPTAPCRKDTIYLCPRKLNVQASDFYTIVVVHELAHFCGPIEGSADAIDDHSYRRRADFFQLTPYNAGRTADCYAYFAGESMLGREAPSG